METRRSDDSPIFGINRYQGSAGLQGLAKELPESLLPVPVLGRMLFPDEPIRGYCVEVRKILRPERPQAKQPAF
jgi:hypothetical protein